MAKAASRALRIETGESIVIPVSGKSVGFTELTNEEFERLRNVWGEITGENVDNLKVPWYTDDDAISYDDERFTYQMMLETTKYIIESTGRDFSDIDDDELKSMVASAHMWTIGQTGIVDVNSHYNEIVGMSRDLMMLKSPRGAERILEFEKFIDRMPKYSDSITLLHGGTNSDFYMRMKRLNPGDEFTFNVPMSVTDDMYVAEKYGGIYRDEVPNFSYRVEISGKKEAVSLHYLSKFGHDFEGVASSAAKYRLISVNEDAKGVLVIKVEGIGRDEARSRKIDELNKIRGNKPFAGRDINYGGTGRMELPSDYEDDVVVGRRDWWKER